MPTFKYKVRDKHGNSSTGIITGESKDQVAKHMEGMGYTPVLIEETHELPGKKILSIFNRVNLTDLNIFTRQFASLIKAGLPLFSCLKALEEQTKSRYFRGIIHEISAEIEGGVSLSNALAKHKNIFNELYVNTIKAGETAGTLDEVLERLADLLEHELDIRSKIKSATIYPAIATCFLCIGFFILVTFVIPKFAKIFETMQGKLPLPTLILIKTNAIIRGYWFLLIILFIAGIWGFLAFIKWPKGRKIWDTFRLKIPVLGPLILKLIMSRFSRTMAMLIKSGVPILTVLDISSRTAGNVVISEAIENIRFSVNEGKGMAEPMRISGVFSPTVAEMVSIGEETGKIDELLFKISEYYDREAEYSIKNLTTLIEPILIVILAIGVLIMALGVFLPMWNMYRLIK